ncbi:unnamed protein product, partial [Rotaria sp. Silwood2]
MSSASTDNTNNSTSNDLLKHNSSDMAQKDAYKASNTSQDNADDFYSNNEIPMNLLPA